MAALELSMEERVQRAKRVEQAVHAAVMQPPPAQLAEGECASRKHFQKHRHEHTPERRQGCGHGKRGALQPLQDVLED